MTNFNKTWHAHITVWTVVQTVLTAIFNFYGDGQISTPPLQNQYPWTDRQKIGRRDYIHEGTSYTKFGRNPFTGGFWANGWNITKIIFYLFIPFFFDHYGKCVAATRMEKIKGQTVKVTPKIVLETCQRCRSRPLLGRVAFLVCS